MLFSTFPRGLPGIGLLLLRAVVGVTIVVHGCRAIAGGPSSIPAQMIAALSIVAGVAVIIGLATPLAAALIGLGTAGVALGWIPWCTLDPVGGGVSTIFLVSMSAAIVMLGPGTVSIDARRHGRREIVIPPEAPADRTTEGVDFDG